MLSVRSFPAPVNTSNHSSLPSSNCSLGSPENQCYTSVSLNTESRAGHSIVISLRARLWEGWREGTGDRHRTVVIPIPFPKGGTKAPGPVPLTALPTCSPTPDSGTAECRGSRQLQPHCSMSPSLGNQREREGNTEVCGVTPQRPQVRLEGTFIQTVCGPTFHATQGRSRVTV